MNMLSIAAFRPVAASGTGGTPNAAAPDAADTAADAAQDRVGKLRSLSIARNENGGGAARPVVPAPRRGKALLVTLVCAQAAAIAWLATGGELAFPDGSAAAGQAGKAAVTATAPSGPAAPGVQFEAQGFVTATRRATLSTRVAGIVTSVRVEVGDRVAKGQVLGTLDAELARRDLQLAERQLSVLEARIRGAGAQTRLAQAEVEREQVLFDRQFSTRTRHQQLATAAAVANASLDSARADLSVAALQVQQQRSLLENYTIRAPFAGIVIEKNAQTGELIAPSGAGGGFTRTGLATIVDMDSLEVVVDVNEQQVTRVRAGQPVSISLYAYPDVKLRGRIVRIMPTADRAKGTLQVRIAILDRDARVLPDMGARVAFL